MLSTTTTKQTPLLTISDLSRDQHAAVNRLYDYDHTLLIAKMGSGKTVCTLQAVSELIQSAFLTRVLVIAPLKVCDNVWAFEAAKWQQLRHLRVAVATGDAKKRKAAIESDSDVLVLNIENVPWFVDQYKDGHGCDGLIVDELSKFKNVGGAGFKKLRRRLKDFKWRVGMTGTPVSEDWVGLYGQMMIVDGGKTFGTDKQRFLDTYFFPTDYQRRSWKLRGGTDKLIVAAMADLVYTMPDYRDELPPIEYWTDFVQLPDAAREVYNELKREMLVELEAGTIVASNEAVLTGKLAQAASGFVYDTATGEAHPLHDEKLRRAVEIVEANQGPVLVAYWFQPDRDQLIKALGAPVYGGSKSKVKTKQLEDDWNAGKLDAMLIHPRSGGHGLNLPAGGCTLLWYGPQWSRDLWEQLNARLWRKGQTKKVTVIVIESENTIDQLITARVEGKGEFDKLLHAHLAAT